MMERRLVTAREIGNVLRELILDAKLAFLLELQDCRSGELFSDGSDSELRYRGHRHVMFHIGKAIAFIKKNPSVLRYEHGRPCAILLDSIGEEQVNQLLRGRHRLVCCSSMSGEKTDQCRVSAKAGSLKRGQT